MSKLILKIDNRENDIVKLIDEYIINENLSNSVTVSIEVLEIGDFIITDEEGNELLIIERKSVNDLASSIQDGRYKEQSLRLTSCDLDNHKIMYLIEGSIDKYSNKYSRIKKDAIYSAMFSLNYYKGFSVVRSDSITETTKMIVKFVKKMVANKENPNAASSSSSNYHSVVKRNKKSNITPDNIGYIILSQIPDVSIKMAQIIIDKHGTIMELINKLQENPGLLDNEKYTTDKGQTRKISYKCIESIKKFLIHKQPDNVVVSV